VPRETSEELSGRVIPFLSNAVGGIKINVSAEDEARARTVVAELDREAPAGGTDDRVAAGLRSLRVDLPDLTRAAVSSIGAGYGRNHPVLLRA
jgi:hypothetical protein